MNQSQAALIKLFSIHSKAILLNSLELINTTSIFLLNNPGLKVLKLNSIFFDI